MDLDTLRIQSMSVAHLDTIVALEQALQTHPWKLSHFQNCLAIGNLALIVTVDSEQVDLDKGDLDKVDLENTEQDINAPVVAYAIVSVGGGEAELLNIGVAPQCQGRGVAGALLQEIFTHIRDEADTIYLEVRASNDKAIALYHKLGFNQVGTRPNYYPSVKGREDALLFAMTLL